MDVSSISGSSSLYSVDTTKAPQSSAEVESADPAPAHVSKMGSLMAQLQQLSQSDPEKFKQVAAEIADKLKAAAGDSTTGKASFLSKMADKFQQASQSGDLSAFQPPQGQQQGASGAHHHHHRAASYAAAPQGQPGGDLAQIVQTAMKDVGGSTARTS
jgi:hypothetical protein